MGNLCVLLNQSLMPLFTFANDNERNKFIRSAKMLKKRIEGKENQNNEINGG